MNNLAVSLTVEELRELVTKAARDAVAEIQARPVREVMTLEEAGELLCLNPQVLSRKVGEFKIPAHRIGREWRFRRSELLAWLSEQAA